MKCARWLALAAVISLEVACSTGSQGFDVVGSNDSAAVDATSDLGVDSVRQDTSQPDETTVADVPIGDDVQSPDDVAPVDAMPFGATYVYAHTDADLYRVDPMTFVVTHIGAFVWPSDGADHEMTDIAITGTNELWGVTYDTLYRVDSATAACTHVAPLAGGLHFNGLSFVPTSVSGTERLLATTLEGSVYLINTVTGATTSAGSYGAYGSSGDLVSVVGAGTFATVVDSTAFPPTEYLARIDTTTGAATVVGATGVFDTWGLGYWGGTLYGFTNGGEMVTIDVTTGHATAVAHGTPLWWGAGVSTHAPITHL